MATRAIAVRAYAISEWQIVFVLIKQGLAVSVGVLGLPTLRDSAASVRVITLYCGVILLGTGSERPVGGESGDLVAAGSCYAFDMPANLTPMYHKAEREFRVASTPAERLACLQKMLTLLPKNKGTDKLQADIRRRLKETRAEVASAGTRDRSSGASQIPRQGAAQIVVIGPPNSGKSRLVTELTAARPEVAPYPFTTTQSSPGMMRVDDVALQLIDTPPLVEGSMTPDLLNLIRATDLVVMCLAGNDLDAVEASQTIFSELRQRHTVLADYCGFEESGLSQLAIKCVIVLTHAGHSDAAVVRQFVVDSLETPLPVVLFEAEQGGANAGHSKIRRLLFESCGLIRVYAKRPREPVDRSAPLVLPRDAIVDDVAAKLHGELAGRVASAKIWRDGRMRSDETTREEVSGAEGEHDFGPPPITVGADSAVRDGDVVEIRFR